MSRDKKPSVPGKILLNLSFLITGILIALMIYFGLNDEGFLAIVFLISWIIFFFLSLSYTMSNAAKLNGRALNKFVARLPEIKTQARVLNKNTGTGSAPEFNRAGFVVVSVYNITFELSDKRRIVFRVNEEQYNTVLENEEGMLSYKENNGQRWFISFQR